VAASAGNRALRDGAPRGTRSRHAAANEPPLGRVEGLEEIAVFLGSEVEAFKTLGPEDLQRVAAATTHRDVRAGETLIVEGARPTEQLYVLRRGTLDLLLRDSLVTVMTAGELLGYPSMLTRTAPAFTVRARTDCVLYCIPEALGVELLSREDGVRWLATTQRDAMLHAARSLSPLPEVQTLPVGSVLRGVPPMCDPGTSISRAAEMMIADGRSAVLVRARDGLGIVTDGDLRAKVVAGGVSRDAPVSAIMSAPVHTIGAGASAAEAGLMMLTLGVSHLPVLDQNGAVTGIVSAGDLMSLEARNPFALRRSLQAARDEDDLVAVAGDIPKLFVDLLDARLDAPTVCRVLTVLHDSLTARLLKLSIERRGAPPVDYAWLVFGSAARHELTLASDQDNGLAYADTDDPAVDDYFRGVAEDVTGGLTRCGFETDSHYVTAGIEAWRKTLSGWRKIFSDSLTSKDIAIRGRAAVCFDYRQSAGQLYVEQALTEIMREVPAHPAFLHWLARTGSGFRPQVSGLRRRLDRVIDIKRGALLPIQNLARYHALARGITTQATLDRLAAVCDLDAEGAAADRTLREAYLTIKQVQLHHHAEAVREGRKADNVVETDTLRPLVRANLQEALREVAAAQSHFPKRAAGSQG
jgi:CBS domain-containing protein